jgi:hypothetical protein
MKRLLALLSLAALCVAAPLQAVDLTLTPASFVPGPRAKYLNGLAGATITAGQVVTLNTSTNRYVLADANVAALIKVEGLAAHGASAGQPLAVLVEDDDLTLGATLSMTAPIYVLSDTAGGIKPSADITTGDFPTVLLIAKSTTKCILRPRVLAGTAAAQ